MSWWRAVCVQLYGCGNQGPSGFTEPGPVSMPRAPSQPASRSAAWSTRTASLRCVSSGVTRFCQKPVA